MSLPLQFSTTRLIAAWALASAWSVQVVMVAFGLKRLPSLLDSASPSHPPAGTSIAVIVPACDEQQAIGACLQSLIDQDWPNLHVIAVNDRSSDTTGDIMTLLAGRYPDRLSVLQVTHLPEGWLGKTHAMAFAARRARSLFAPEWLLFTDGDVIFHPECLRRSLALAEAQQADHFVTLPTAVIQSAGEGMLMAFLQVIGLWGARLWRVNDDAARDAIGIGAFNLLRTTAYEQVGGFERLRLQVLEDLALGRLVRNAGLRQRVALAPRFVQVHWATGVRGVLNTMTKNLFAIFQFRIPVMIAACCGLSFLCLGPLAGMIWRQTRLPSAIALVSIACVYQIAGRRLSRLRMLNVLGFPVSAVLFIYAIVRSTAVTLSNGGVSWRGTFYPLKELRRAALRLR